MLSIEYCMRCSVGHNGAVSGSVGAVCCSVLQCAAVCCSALQCVVMSWNMLQRVAVCLETGVEIAHDACCQCSVLQRVAVCYIVLQHA